MTEAPIFLTGFMGVGKSRIGRLLADRLGWGFLDTDQMVQERTGMSVAEVFARQGEAAFRDLEHECVREAALLPEVVVSLGGGAVVQERNWKLVRAAGILVCIAADVDTILRRVGRRRDRPLLTGLGPAEKRAAVERLLAERQPYYEQAEITVLSSDERSPEETTRILLKAIEQWHADHPS